MCKLPVISTSPTHVLAKYVHLFLKQPEWILQLPVSKIAFLQYWRANFIQTTLQVNSMFLPEHLLWSAGLYRCKWMLPVICTSPTHVLVKYVHLFLKQLDWISQLPVSKIVFLQYWRANFIQTTLQIYVFARTPIMISRFI